MTPRAAADQLSAVNGESCTYGADGNLTGSVLSSFDYNAEGETTRVTKKTAVKDDSWC